LRNWLRGPPLTPVAWSFNADEIAAYTEVWQIKWNYYEQTFPEGILWTVERMSEAEIKVRAGWLVSCECMFLCSDT
jgi:hypothetical protein